MRTETEIEYKTFSHRSGALHNPLGGLITHGQMTANVAMQRRASARSKAIRNRLQGSAPIIVSKSAKNGLLMVVEADHHQQRALAGL